MAKKTRKPNRSNAPEYSCGEARHFPRAGIPRSNLAANNRVRLKSPSERSLRLTNVRNTKNASISFAIDSIQLQATSQSYVSLTLLQLRCRSRRISSATHVSNWLSASVCRAASAASTISSVWCASSFLNAG